MTTTRTTMLAAAIGMLAALFGTSPPLRAQEADHPSNTPMVVDSDFGLAP